MESMSALPSDPAGQLAAAESARQRLAASLGTPAWFHTWLGVATTVQIGAVAYGLSDDASGPRLVAVALGALFFAVVVAVLWLRFRRLNGARVGGLFSKALMGTSNRAALAETAGLGVAVWAGLVGLWWLVALASVSGGVGYAVSARLWWRDYQRDPASHAHGDSRGMLAVVGLATVAGLVALLVLG
ncbi:hypothetical protein [Nocardioides sp.]|uniref:hypothetical protein n=1 Tax=Nocardioides sp. TaxID=35761 RepID=UPI001A1E936D|nr:hypothetical protein [Nocardioides sp.]MBJ7359468.1 hypothetical protein [Nocardioides sp.]